MLESITSAEIVIASEDMVPQMDPQTLWKPTPVWHGQAAYLIGGGSSLKTFDFNLLKGKNTIGANFAYKLGADICQWVAFSDTGWFNTQIHALKQYSEEGGKLVSCATSIAHLNLPWVRKMQRIRDGLHFTDGAIGWNYSTGAMMINLAMYFGAAQIFLMGFDMNKQQNVSHWHHNYAHITDDNSFARHTKGFVNVFHDIVRRFPTTRVFNVTNGFSKLPMFDRISIEQFKRILLMDQPRKEAA